jgi:phosphoenolpyruvate carboxykinase (ATP)
MPAKKSSATVPPLNLSREDLIQAALENNEGTLCANGALVVETGQRTGRSPRDRFIVKDAMTQDTVDWGDVNQPVDAALFTRLWDKTQAYLRDHRHYTAALKVGAHPQHYLPVQVTTEYAWHNMFAHNLFIHEQPHNPSDKPVWEILNVPNLSCDPVLDGTHSDGCVMINFVERRVLIVGMRYAGEMKKAMFSVLNYFCPEHDVLPMHCAANVGEDGSVALFFGLSGTGKTTLSADPKRYLVGDDEHGWGADGVFNFEGGCYAKCINLSAEKEPFIWQAIQSGTILENVIVDADNVPDYNDTRLTQNTRAAYPRAYIPKCVPENQAGHPQAVIFLTCDLYGVLPPVACLSTEQAAYYFLSGYTALVGSTEVGAGPGVKPTFSTCFGAPFFPRAAQCYADLLMKRVVQTNAKVYLVNTGWTGGAYGAGGERFDIPTTRAIIDNIVTGQVEQQPKVTMPGFNFSIPTSLPNVDDTYLDPRNTWSDPEEFLHHQKLLITSFRDNFRKFKVATSITDAGPEVM